MIALTLQGGSYAYHTFLVKKKPPNGFRVCNVIDISERKDVYRYTGVTKTHGDLKHMYYIYDGHTL